MTLSVPMTPVPDCCISILADIDGSLANVLSKHLLVLVSCTTISVYVNLSKNVLPLERIKARPPPEEAASPHLRVQRYGFSANWQNFTRLFYEKKATFTTIHYIYNTRASEIVRITTYRV